MFAQFMAALKAIPAIVDGLKELKQSIIYLQDSNTQRQVDMFKQEMRKELEGIKATGDRDEILNRIHALNTKLSE